MEEVGVKQSCKHSHSEMHKKRGYSFCPHCGEKLEVKKHCEWCERDFYSDAAYLTHVIKAHRNLKPLPCPDCHTRMLPSNTKSRKFKTYRCDRCELTFKLTPDGNLKGGRKRISTDQKIDLTKAVPKESKYALDADNAPKGNIDWDAVKKDIMGE